MARIALGISYDGSHWQGWQTQPHGQSVQDQLEQALETFVGHPVATICAGRTDAGVHATSQVVHIDVDVERRESAWVRGLNSHLPDSVAVHWAREVPETFHARFSALARTYQYIIFNAGVRHPLWCHRAGWCFRPLDDILMNRAAQLLLGKHDFSSFRSSQCQAATPVRHMQAIRVTRHAEFVIIELTANAFLHHMVRNIVGELVLLGQGKTDLAHFEAVLSARDRTLAAPTFAASGLYLTDVQYPPDLIDMPTVHAAGSVPGLIVP